MMMIMEMNRGGEDISEQLLLNQYTNPPLVTVQQYFCTLSHSIQSVHAATQHVNSTIQKCAACHFIGQEEE